MSVGELRELLERSKLNPEFLKQLTDKLGNNAEQLFNLSIRQNYYFALWDFVTALIFGLGIFLIWKLWKDKDNEFLWLKIGISIVIGFFIIMLFFAVGYRLVNPQFQAFVDIIEILKN